MSVKKILTKHGERYWVRVRLREVNPETGKRLERKQTVDDYLTAKRIEIQWLAEINANTYADVRRITFGEVLTGYLERTTPPVTALTTHSTYTFLAERHLLPALGDVTLDKLDTKMLDAFYTKKSKSGRLDGKGGLAPKTLRHLHGLVHAALADAKRHYQNYRNAAETTKPPRLKRKGYTTWTVAECQRFHKAAQRQVHHPLWLVIMLTGMRRGEALGIRWSDIDWEEKTIYIRQTIVEVKGRRYIKDETKTEAGVRTVRLSPACVAALREHRVRQNEIRLKLGGSAEYERYNLVFTTRLGEPILPRTIDRAFKTLCARAEVPEMVPHDLRRTHSTLLMAAGIDPATVAKRLGHANPDVTLDIYTNVTADMDEKAAEAIDRILKLA